MRACLTFWTTLASILLLSLTTLAADQSPQVVPLWPGGAPGSEGQTSPEVVTQRGEPGLSFPVVSNIHRPTLTVFLPEKKNATGAAVVICPGGGHRFLSIDHEGYDVAKWLNQRGIAGFVLKYRLARSEGSPYKIDVHALQDVQRAIRLVRARGDEWGVKPDRVGVLGFSAGGEIAALAATHYDEGLSGAPDAVDRQKSRPDFQALIYPGIPRDLNITKETPPTFLACAYDDRPTISEGLATLYLALKKAGVPAELHIYTSGGHGFGIRNRPIPVSTWPARLQEWMSDLKMLQRH